MIITIQLEIGRSQDTKRRAVAAFTQAAIDTLGAKPAWVNVLFEEYSKENWGIDGKIQLDRHGPEPVTLGNKD